MIVDFGGGFFLRRATAADRAALAAICLKTGDSGKDASGREDDPELLGILYTVPYQVLEPELAFIVDSPSGAAGYLLGAADTAAFNASLASNWYPVVCVKFCKNGVAVAVTSACPPRSPRV